MGKRDYDHIERTLVSNMDFLSSDSGVDYVVLKSLDDVFFGFEDLVSRHPYHANINFGVGDYLKEKFEDSLSIAVNNSDYYKIGEISFKVGKIFSPKSYGFFRRKREEFALSSAFSSLVKQYMLCNPGS